MRSASRRFRWTPPCVPSACGPASAPLQALLGARPRLAVFVTATVGASLAVFPSSAALGPVAPWLRNAYWAALALTIAVGTPGYQLWCPYCRGGGGVGEKTTPPSVPQPL